MKGYLKSTANLVGKLTQPIVKSDNNYNYAIIYSIAGEMKSEIVLYTIESEDI